MRDPFLAATAGRAAVNGYFFGGGQGRRGFVPDAASRAGGLRQRRQ